MSGTCIHEQNYNEAGLYEIRLHGHLDNHWSGWFEDLTLTLEQNGDTLISGQVSDQAALFGLLRKVRDTGMQLVSVNRITATRADSCGDES